VVRAARRRVHDDIGVGDVLGGVADENARAERFEPLRHCRRLDVAAAHLPAEIEQYFGDPAHADAADADEMHLLHATEQSAFPLPATPPTAAAAPAAARGRASRRLASPMRRKRAGSESSSTISRASVSPLKSGSATSNAAPESTSARALAV